jgi:ankyrin repeat protein
MTEIPTGKLETTLIFLNLGADPNIDNYYRDTPLILTKRTVRKDVVEELIASGALVDEGIVWE